MSSHLIVKRFAVLALAFFMIMPAALGTMGVGNEDISDSNDSSDSQAIVHLGERHFKVSVEGKPRETYLAFCSSTDGQTWSAPLRITGQETVPATVRMLSGAEKLHIVWQDTAARMQKVGYLNYDPGTGQFGKAQAFNGAYPSLDTDGRNVLVAYSRGMSLELLLSRDDGQSFREESVNNGYLFEMADARFSGRDIEVAFHGGILDTSDGSTSQRGIYSMNLDGLSGKPCAAVLLARTSGAVTRISLGDSVEWTEISESSVDDFAYYRGLGKALVGSTPRDVKDEAPVQMAPSRLPPKKWTFICYLDADDGVLDPFGTEDLNEMEIIGSNADLNIVVLIDNLGSGNSHAYYVEQDSNMGAINSLEIPLTSINPSWGAELNMGDPQVPIDFINYVYENYPADRYMLDMWDHGGTWNWGMCSDASSGDRLTSLEVRGIYETLRADTGFKTLFDVISYDECVMADASLYYDEMPFTKYMCNSEMSIGADGFEYDMVLGHLNDDLDMASEEAAFWIFQSYVDTYGTSGQYTTMSVINVSMFATSLMPAINNLAQKGLHEISTFRGDFNTAADNAAYWEGESHVRDLYDFMLEAQPLITSAESPEIAAAIQRVLDAAEPNPPGTQYGDPAWDHDRAIMIHNQNPGEHGMAIYCDDTSYDTLYDTMTIIETNWDEFLKGLWGSSANDPNAEPSVAISSPTDGSYVQRNSTVPITGTAGDTDGTVQRVDVAVDTEHWEAAAGTTSWSYSWDTAGWAPGWYTIMARSYDGQDFSEPVVHDIQIIVDPDLPDLTLWPGDVGISDPTPDEGDLITLDATIYNVGVTDPAMGCQIGFYVGPPALGDLIGITVTSPGTINAGNNSGWGTVDWDTSGYAGVRSIYVVADPLSAVQELTEFNNTVVRTITVAGFNVDVACADNTSTIQSGGERDYFVTVTNTGTYLDTFDLSIVNPTSWNAFLDISLVMLAPGASAVVTLTVQAPLSAVPSESAAIWVEATSQSDLSKTDSVETVTTVLPGILVVDDDPNDVSTSITNALDNIEEDYDLVEYNDLIDIEPYKIVIWDVGDEYSSNYFSSTRQTKISEYLGMGGSLYITGVELAYDLQDQPGTFLEDVLGVLYISDNPGDTVVDGVVDDPVSGDFTGVTLEAALLSTNRDGIAPNVGAEGIFYDTSQSDCYGVRYDAGTYKVVYTSFNFAQFSAFSDYRDILMYRIIEWLNPLPKQHDICVASIDSHLDGATYPSGSQDVTSTVCNDGQVAEGPFDVRCVITELQSAGIPDTYHEQDFSEVDFPPTDWQVYTTGTTGTWARYTGSYAGGISPEARFSYGESGTGTARLYAGPFDTAGRTEVELQWRNMVDDYTGATGVACRVQTSTDGSTWHDTSWVWDDTVTPGDMAASLQTLELNNSDVGSSTFYIGFAVIGNSYQMDYWYIDDVLLHYAPTVTEVEVYNEVRSTTGTMDPLDDQQLTWNYGFPNEYQYRIEIMSELGTDEKASNDYFTVTITILGGMSTYDIPVSATPGWNFVSFPLAATGAPADVFDDSAGDGTTTWDIIMWYDPLDATDPWKTHRAGGTSNDLASVNRAMGFWIHITSGGADNLLTVEGAPPTTTNIQLYHGWNLVGYPSSSPALASTTLPAQADLVAVYQAAPPYVTDTSDLGSVTMSQGNAYWVHVSADCVWTVTY